MRENNVKRTFFKLIMVRFKRSPMFIKWKLARVGMVLKKSAARIYTVPLISKAMQAAYSPAIFNLIIITRMLPSLSHT